MYVCVIKPRVSFKRCCIIRGKRLTWSSIIFIINGSHSLAVFVVYLRDAMRGWSRPWSAWYESNDTFTTLNPWVHMDAVDAEYGVSIPPAITLRVMGYESKQKRMSELYMQNELPMK